MFPTPFLKLTFNLQQLFAGPNGAFLLEQVLKVKMVVMKPSSFPGNSGQF